jgi:predicted TIM-barrel fold metal-dependent hydrolase
MDRYFRPLIERYPNFHIDISRYELDMGIADLWRKYGPDRLLFATNYPATVMGAPMLTLLHSDIPPEAKQAIASGNLKRMLAGARV